VTTVADEAPAAASTYVYVDCAFGSVARRNHVRRIADIRYDTGPERYISHRRATESLLTWVRTHTNAAGNPTVEGFDGPVWDSSLPFDFDDKHDPAHALVWVREFLHRQEQYDVPLDALRIYFSGAKGFHVEMPHTLFGGFLPSSELHMWEKAAALELMGGIPFDTAVYDKLRLWRLTNTLNAKGQRYKVRLSLDEVLHLSMREIDALAVNPRDRLPVAPDEDWNTNDYLFDVWQRAQLPVVREAPSQDWSTQRHSRLLLATVATAIGELWPASEPGISRHTDYLLPLSGFLCRQMEQDVAAEVLKEAVRHSGDRNFLDDRTRHWEDEIERLTEGSARKIAAGEPVEGLPTVAKHWPELAEFLSTAFVVVQSSPKSSKTAHKEQALVLTAMLDLLGEPPEIVAYIVDGLLPSGGVSLWGAKPKAGKSVAVRNLAMSVATGEDFLDRHVNQGTVLVLALEEKRAEVANHFRSMGASDEHIHVHVGAAPNSSREGLAALQAAIVLYQPTLVIVDPVLKLVRVRDSSDYAELTRELEPVIELARNHNCHIAVTHHLGKMLREGGDDVLGSTAIFGAVDTLVLIRRRKDNQRVVQTIQRYGKDLDETMLPLDEITGRVTLGVGVSEARLEDAKRAVLELLDGLKEDESLERKEVREQSGVDSALAYKALQALVEGGQVERLGAGKRGDPHRFRKANPIHLVASQNDSELSSFVVFHTSREKQETNKSRNLEKGVCEACGEPLESPEEVEVGLHWKCAGEVQPA